jgi:hypothetical protein
MKISKILYLCSVAALRRADPPSEKIKKLKWNEAFPDFLRSKWERKSPV